MAATALAGGHPRMNQVLNALRNAKTSASPLIALQAASKALHKGRHLTGYRAEAITLVDKAIADLNAGDRAAADKSIDAAIVTMEKLVVGPGGR
jgi:hypothetical protein